MVRKYEVVIKLAAEGPGPKSEEDSTTEYILFTVTNSRPMAQGLADAYAFLVGRTAIRLFVRAVDSVQGGE
jgi:hypothetical protein